jgi:hypothetical protein
MTGRLTFGKTFHIFVFKVMNSTEKGVTFLRRILIGGSHFYVKNDHRVNILRESLLSVTPAASNLTRLK